MKVDTHETFDLPRQRERAKDPLPLFLFSIAALLLVLLSDAYTIPIFIALFFLIWVIGKGGSPGVVFKRLAGPFALALVLLVTQSLFNGHEVLATLDLRLFTICIYKEGLCKGLFLLSKVIAGSLVLVSVSLSLSIPDFIRCLSFLKIPDILILESLLTFRYIYLLREEAQRVRQAQLLRGGYITWRKGIRSTSILGSSIIIRSLDRASHIQDAARLRLGSGRGLPALPRVSKKRIDIRELLLLVMAFLTFLLSWKVYHVGP